MPKPKQAMERETKKKAKAKAATMTGEELTRAIAEAKKIHEEIGGCMQPFPGAVGSGESQSMGIVGSIKASDCIIAHTALNDAIKKRNFTGAILMKLLEEWKTRAPNSGQKIMDYYKKDTPLEYFAVGVFKGDIDKFADGYINMGILSDLKSKIGPDYQLNNRVSVYVPELIPLLEASSLKSGI